MSLKFGKTPYVVYGDAPRMGDTRNIVGDNYLQRLAPHARPIATAPSNSWFKGYTRDGGTVWAVQRRDSFREIKNFPDYRDGTPHWRETGNTVDLVAWST